MDLFDKLPVALRFPAGGSLTPACEITILCGFVQKLKFPNNSEPVPKLG
jgi:hypothetical protein